jgi:glycosyltransferase involved in cell wall biosynthesis
MTNPQDLASRMLVCTILPTYNERDNILLLIDRLIASVPSPYLVLVIDDNSPDGTWEVVEEIASHYSDPQNLRGENGGSSAVALVRRIDEKGLTSAIQKGIDVAIAAYEADIITWMDCDLSMPPEDVSLLVQVIKEDRADMAIGSRWVRGGKDVAHGLMARTLSWIINTFAIVVAGRYAHDYTSGFMAARAELLEQIRLEGDYGEYCIDLICRAGRAGFRLMEVPYVCVPRNTGESKTGINLWDYLVKGRKYVATIWRLRRWKKLNGNEPKNRPS